MVSTKLTPRREAAILALLTQPTVRAAARKARVSEATLQRWLREQSFRERYERERTDLFTTAKTRLLSAAEECVSTLVAIQADPRARCADRVNAARSVLNLCMGIEEHDIILARLERLEGSSLEILGE
jgi:hypothetical protein